MVHQAPGGIKKKKGGEEMTVPEFAMPPDAVPGIAQVIVNAWTRRPNPRQDHGPYPTRSEQRVRHARCCRPSHSGNQCSGTRDTICSAP